MTADIELVLECLRAIQADVSDIKERMGRVERRLSTIEKSVDSALSDGDPETELGPIRRLEHINGSWN